MNSVLSYGFAKACLDQDVTLWEEEAQALKFSEQNEVLICRVALGKDGFDYEAQEGGKWLIHRPEQIVPYYLVELN